MTAATPAAAAAYSASCPGVGDEPRKVFGADDAEAGAGRGAGEPLPFPADPGVDVDEAGPYLGEKRLGVGEALRLAPLRARRRHEIGGGLRKGQRDPPARGRQPARQRQHVPPEARGIGAVGG